jgi:hypothetical protein
MRSSLKRVSLVAGAVLGLAASAQAEFVPLLTFEGPDTVGPADGGEGLGVNNGGVVGAFGATEGTSALVFNDTIATNGVWFDIGTINGNPADPNGGGHAERLANFLVCQQAGLAGENGSSVTLEFDFTYDATGMTEQTFFQVGTAINSNNGFDGCWFGGLNQGNIGPGGNFPQPGNEAGAGATFTILDPADLVTDFVGAIRFSIPTGPGKVLEFGTGIPPDGVFDFAQLLFNRNGAGVGGTFDVAFDRVGFNIIPPTRYWDIDGANPGAGGATPAGTWDGAATNFNTDSTGGAGGTINATSGAGDIIVFAAGGDATGTYTVTVSGTQSAGQVSFEEGTVTLTGGTLAVGTFNVSSGVTATVASNLAAPGSAVTKTGPGTLQAPMLPQNHAVTISEGTVRILESAPGYGTGHPAGDNAFVSQPSSLSIADGAVLDITNNDVVIDYSGASPIAAYEALVASAYNVTGDWLGDGITSSIAAIDGAYVVAIADNAALPAPFGSAQGGPLFSGVDVDLDTILIKFTHRADVDLDGAITPNDASIFGTNYSEGDPANWAMGDMDYDGIFTPNDASIFGTFYDESLATLPEPASAVALLALAGLTTARRRRG